MKYLLFVFLFCFCLACGEADRPSSTSDNEIVKSNPDENPSIRTLPALPSNVVVKNAILRIKTIREVVGNDFKIAWWFSVGEPGEGFGISITEKDYLIREVYIVDKNIRNILSIGIHKYGGGAGRIEKCFILGTRLASKGDTDLTVVNETNKEARLPPEPYRLRIPIFKTKKLGLDEEGNIKTEIVSQKIYYADLRVFIR